MTHQEAIFGQRICQICGATWQQYVHKCGDGGRASQPEKVGSTDGLGGPWINVNEALPPIGEVVLVCELSHDGKLYVSTLASLEKQYMREDDPPEWKVAANCGGYECEELDCEPVCWAKVSPPNDTEMSDLRRQE